jgi:hypothetical protein
MADIMSDPQIKEIKYAAVAPYFSRTMPNILPTIVKN